MKFHFCIWIANAAAGLACAISPVAISAETIGNAASVTPAWAYPISSPPKPSTPSDIGQKRRVPNSPVELTQAQTVDRFAAPDWHPEEHPSMPDVVAHGLSPKVYACAYCHLPNGAGRSENASLAGLSAAYIVQQVADMKSGARRSSAPAMIEAMTDESKAVTDSEVQIAAEYFTKLKPKNGWIKVVEADTVPKTEVIPVNVLVPAKVGGTEPIGDRIIEIPTNPALTVLRDSQSGYIAYVPKGSLVRGKELVTTGGTGKTIACATCHGNGLLGVGNIPLLAGRSPSYIFRQLYDIKAGVRMSTATALMKAPVANLTETDMVSIAAYIASLGQSTSKL